MLWEVGEWLPKDKRKRAGWILIKQMARKLLGTLRIFSLHGAGNPREFFSSRAPSLLKFQSLKLKGIEEKRRGGLGTPHGTGCVADSEHLGESTGSSVVNKL